MGRAGQTNLCLLVDPLCQFVLVQARYVMPESPCTGYSSRPYLQVKQQAERWVHPTSSWSAESVLYSHRVHCALGSTASQCSASKGKLFHCVNTKLCQWTILDSHKEFVGFSPNTPIAYPLLNYTHSRPGPHQSCHGIHDLLIMCLVMHPVCLWRLPRQ